MRSEDAQQLLAAHFGTHGRVLAPWRRATKRGEGPVPGVSDALDGVQSLQPVDPTPLLASQRWITRAGIAYYLGDTYERTGMTYADQWDRANRFPLLADMPQGLVILTGHHRSAAALLAGRPVWARIAPRAAASAGYRSVTALIHVGVCPYAPTVPVDDAPTLVEFGTAVCLATDDEAGAVMSQLGATPGDLTTQISLSRTGRLI